MVYDLLPEPHSDWASVPCRPDAGAPEDELELFDIAAKLPCRRRSECNLEMRLLHFLVCKAPDNDDASGDKLTAYASTASLPYPPRIWLAFAHT